MAEKDSSPRKDAQEAEKMEPRKKQEQDTAPKESPEIYFFQWGPTFQQFSTMPAYYKAIKGLIHSSGYQPLVGAEKNITSTLTGVFHQSPRLLLIQSN